MTEVHLLRDPSIRMTSPEFVEAFATIKEADQPDLVKVADCGLLENQWWIGGYELGIAFPPDWVGSYYFDIWKELGNDAVDPGSSAITKPTSICRKMSAFHA